MAIATAATACGRAASPFSAAQTPQRRPSTPTHPQDPRTLMPGSGSSQMRAVAADLGKAGGVLKRSLTRAIARGGKITEAQIKRNALAIPASGEKSTGLREALANATHTEVGTGLAGITARV